MSFDEFLKYVIWIVFFIIALFGLYSLLKSLSII